MKRKIVVKFAFSLIALAGLLSSGVASAQSCSTWASNIVAEYQSSAPPSQGARIATNQSDGRYVSYAVPFEYPLVYVPGHGYGAGHIPPSLQSTGALAQFFSDRMFTFNGGEYPFNPAATDNLGVTIWLGNGGGYTPGLGYSIQPGEVTFTLYSWGNATFNFTAERCDGMIYGLNGNTGMLLSLFPLAPPPK